MDFHLIQHHNITIRRRFLDFFAVHTGKQNEEKMFHLKSKTEAATALGSIPVACSRDTKLLELRTTFFAFTLFMATKESCILTVCL